MKPNTSYLSLIFLRTQAIMKFPTSDPITRNLSNLSLKNQRLQVAEYKKLLSICHLNITYLNKKKKRRQVAFMKWTTELDCQVNYGHVVKLHIIVILFINSFYRKQPKGV